MIAKTGTAWGELIHPRANDQAEKNGAIESDNPNPSPGSRSFFLGEAGLRHMQASGQFPSQRCPWAQIIGASGCLGQD